MRLVKDSQELISIRHHHPRLGVDSEVGLREGQHASSASYGFADRSQIKAGHPMRLGGQWSLYILIPGGR